MIKVHGKSRTFGVHKFFSDDVPPLKSSFETHTTTLKCDQKFCQTKLVYQDLQIFLWTLLAQEYTCLYSSRPGNELFCGPPNDCRLVACAFCSSFARLGCR
jgi:hypothetical protein